MTDGTHRRAPLLDGRLSAAMALAQGAQVFADIGADHGRLSAVMLLAGARSALVADISAAALEKARKRLHALGLDNRATFCRGRRACGAGRAEAAARYRVCAGHGWGNHRRHFAPGTYAAWRCSIDFGCADRSAHGAPHGLRGGLPHPPRGDRLGGRAGLCADALYPCACR